MTHDDATAEAARRQAEDPSSTWTVVRRGDAWAVARIGIKPPQTPSGTATQPPPPAPREEPPDQTLNRLYQV